MRLYYRVTSAICESDNDSIQLNLRADIIVLVVRSLMGIYNMWAASGLLVFAKHSACGGSGGLIQPRVRGLLSYA